MKRIRPTHAEAPVARAATECKFCGHFYIYPCDEKKQKECPNIKLNLKEKPRGKARAR